jgi:PilZ domain-containing protein
MVRDAGNPPIQAARLRFNGKAGSATMYDHGQKTKSASKSTGTGEADRRGNDRHTVTASCEVVELVSGAKFSTRTTDLGPGGCFVDTMVPFPVGSNVRVKVHKGKTQFETGGLVVYSQAGLGMGIAFSEMDESQRNALDLWFAELTGEKQAAAHDFGSPASPSTESRLGDKAALVRLVRLMISKGILTEAEGASVLMDPLL